MKKLSIILISATLIAIPVLVLANHQDPQKIAQRSAPVGQVYRTGDIIEKAVVAVAAGPRTAEDIYKTCAGCHDTGAANAPVVGNLEHWAPRISKGLESLIASAINGTAAGMPPKGLCMDCTDDEIKATVEFMLEKSQ